MSNVDAEAMAERLGLTEPIIRQLQEREWIEVIGHRETSGRPALYATTQKFLDELGLKALEQLPPLDDAAAPPEAFALGVATPAADAVKAG